jgi:hypothetical protein
MPDVPGNLARAAALIGEATATSSRWHQRAFSPLLVKSTEVNFIIETQNAAHATEVVTALRAAGFEVHVLEDAGTGGF